METVNEEDRLRALRRYHILDTPPDGSFDRLTLLATKIFNMPIAIISLVDTNRIWFKSKSGLDVNQIDRDPGLCASAILSKDIYIVENALEDPRTLANPLVASEFGLRFYAAAPLTTSDGHNLGTFCIIDQKQRYLTEPQKQVLQELAAIAMDEIEIRLAARNSAIKTQELLLETQAQLRNYLSATELNPNGITNKGELQEQILATKNTLHEINKRLLEIQLN